MTAMLIHDDPTIFPSPKTLIPDRWLDRDNKVDNRVRKYLTPFSKGTRQCVVMNSAYAMLYPTIATTYAPIPLRALPD